MSSIASSNVDCLKCYGKIYLNKKKQVVLGCEVCQEQLLTFRNFINHLALVHFNNCHIVIKRYKKKTQNKYHAAAVPDGTYDNTEDAQSMAESDGYENAVDDDNLDATQSDTELKTVHVLQRRTRLKDEVMNEDGKLICNICNAMLANRASYTAHMRRHTGNKKLVCDYCPKRFFTRSELNTHMCSHTGERPFVCATCGKRFLTSGHLTGHMLRHTNEKRYKCKHCDKRFFGSSEWKEHMNMHLDQRNYVCKVCNASFKKHGVLSQHMKIHENKRKYICNICNAAFNQGPALYSHKKTHGEKLETLNLADLRNEPIQ